MSPLGLSPAPVRRQQEEVRTPALRKQTTFVLKSGALLNLLVLIFAATLTALVILNLSQKALIAQDALRLQRLRNSLQVEKTRSQRFFYKKTKLESLRRIEKIALEELNMVTPSDLKYILLPPKISQMDLPANSADKRLVDRISSFDPKEAALFRPR